MVCRTCWFIRRLLALWCFLSKLLHCPCPSFPHFLGVSFSLRFMILSLFAWVNIFCELSYNAWSGGRLLVLVAFVSFISFICFVYLLSLFWLFLVAPFLPFCYFLCFYYPLWLFWNCILQSLRVFFLGSSCFMLGWAVPKMSCKTACFVDSEFLAGKGRFCFCLSSTMNFGSCHYKPICCLFYWIFS